jgi:hypothetical protein
METTINSRRLLAFVRLLSKSMARSRLPLDFWILTMLDCTIGFNGMKRRWEEHRFKYR